MRRTPRDWLADISLFLFAVGFWALTEDSVAPESLSPSVLFVEQLAGALACAALFLRRRWPVQLTVVLLVAGSLSHFVTGALLVALFTVVTCRPPRTTVWVAGLAFAPFPVFLARGPDPGLPATASAITYFALVAGTFGWGLYVRSRRELVRSLRERAERAGDEARRQAREDMAREMHDVLAHRLSLLSVHAGALEFNPGASEEEVCRAAGVIRDSAHQALEDMREIIGVLRSEGDGGRPQPVLADLDRLADESRAAGASITLRQRIDRPEDTPALTGRTAYRIAQEGLTNARKHAPEAEITVTVSGGPSEGLTVEVRNAVSALSALSAASAPAPASASAAPRDAGPAIPGAGQGLIGLAERTRLVGGELEHGRTGADFRLRAWLPWRP